MEPEGEVIELLNDYKLVANIGEEHGVKKTHRYIVYALSEEIIDPNTNTSLGQIEYEKAIVKPTNIMPEMSVMESAEKTQSPLQNQMTAFTGSKKKLAYDVNFEHGDDEVKRGDAIKFHKEIKTD